MASKHDELTRSEFESFEIDEKVSELIKKVEREHPDLNRKEIRILDWGCGRGRTVLKLLRQGYTAYGVEIDEEVMKNGYPLFEIYDYNPEQYLYHIDDIKTFQENSFHLIVTEQVLEHVEDIHHVICEQSRLTASGGFGFHSFPATKMIKEVHLRMPFVHWFPKNSIRRYWIALMILLSLKPKKVWPETVDKSFWETVDIYYNYMNQKTFYRDIRHLFDLFNRYGFDVSYYNSHPKKSVWNLFPDFLSMNGFPRRTGRLVVQKR